MTRYYVTKKRVNFGWLNMFSRSRYVVRRSDSSWNLYVGSQLECQRFAQELTLAYNAGVCDALMEDT